jgi:hypothetical protein
MSDIKFVGNDVHIEATVLKSTSWDIELDNASRRSSTAGKRRAFVHDFQDGLTLNWANDYPGGITLNGKVKVSELVGTQLRCSHYDLILDNAGRRSSSAGHRRALVHSSGDALTVNFNGDYPGGVIIRGNVSMPQGAALSSVTGTTIKLSHHTLQLDNAGRRSAATGQRRALVHASGDMLTLNFAQDYPGGVTIRGTVKVPETLLVKNQDLLALVQALQSQVTALQTQVTQLSARVQALESA